MLLDAEDFREPVQLQADVCIVGAGPAGITLALNLAEFGRTVVLLESGGHTVKAHTQSLNQGLYKSSFTPKESDRYLTNSRLRALGGTSNHWRGWVRPLDPIDFETRAWMPHSGWPIAFSDLKTWYVSAAPWLQINIPPEFGGQTLARPRIIDDPVLRDVHYLFSPPTRFGKTYGERLRSHEHITTVLHGNAIDIRPTGRRIREVTFRTQTTPQLHSVQARYIVFAAGGVENPRLLLNAQARHRIPENDNVGRFFMDHPHVNVSSILVNKRSRLLKFYPKHRPKAYPHGVKPVLTLTEAIKRRDALTNMSFELISSNKVPPFADAMHGLSQYVTPATPKAYKAIVCHLRAEHIPNPDSRVELVNERDSLGLNRVRLNWQLTALDHDCIERSVRHVAGAFGRFGLGRVHTRLIPGGPWPRGQGGYHHMGTTRMSQSRSEGVVNKDCRVFGTENLYVAGSSVFPTTGYANPTYTIVALSLRLGAHLNALLAK